MRSFTTGSEEDFRVTHHVMSQVFTKNLRSCKRKLKNFFEQFPTLKNILKVLIIWSPKTVRLLGSFDFRKFENRGCTSVFVVLSYRRWRKCLSDIRPDNCRSGSFSTSFLLSENIERKRTMQTASMRQNIFKNLKTHGNTAFGSVRPYAPISLLDNEHLFDYSIGKLSVRLRC